MWGARRRRARPAVAFALARWPVLFKAPGHTSEARGRGPHSALLVDSKARVTTHAHPATTRHRPSKGAAHTALEVGRQRALAVQSGQDEDGALVAAAEAQPRAQVGGV